MKLFDTLTTHADLMHQMAHTVGADLGDALLRGDLSGQELRSAVVRCANCGAAQECPGWLEAHQTGASDVPDFCENKPMMERLREA